MDILFKNITVVTMDVAEPVLYHAYLGITGDKIVYVGKNPPAENAQKVIFGQNKVLMPGLVNAHTHIAMSALRGYADDQTLTSWLFDSILPAEAKLTGEMVYHSARLGMMEAIASGTTAICDMYPHSPEIARAAKELGLRAHIGNVPFQLDEGFDLADRSVRETMTLLEIYENDPLISVFTGVHAAHNSNPAVWEWVLDTAGRYKLPLSLHMSETEEDVASCIKRFGTTPAVILEKAGFFRHPMIAAHCVHLTEEDMEIMGHYGASAASCPVSNLKLASGIAPLTRMQAKGMNISLGTDGVASNNSFDLFEEIKLAALLQKNLAKDASVIDAFDALSFATMGGNLALGRGGQCGMLKEGYDADMAMLDFDALHLNPCYNVLSNIVYAARGSDVELTMVRGRILYENRRFTCADPKLAAEQVRRMVVPIIRG